MAKGRKTKRARTPEEVFHVEVVKKARVVPANDEGIDDDKGGNKKKGKEKQKNGQSTDAPAKWEYFVKWAGYDEEANSWEPEENLEACSRLLGSFWEHVGMDNSDYQIGFEIKAKKDWIEKEKAYFAKEFQTAQEELKRQEKEGNRSPKKKKKKVKHTPSEEAPAESSKKKSGVSQPPPPPLEPGSSSEDEVSLLSQIKVLSGSQNKRKRVVSSSSSEDQPLQSSQHPKSKKIPKLNDTSTNVAKSTTPPPDSPTSLFSQPSSPIMVTTKISLQESTTGSVPNKPLTPSIPPMTVVRQSNPHAKIANMSSGMTPSASGISTKQRLAQGALAPTAPKEVGKGKMPLQPKPPLPTRKTSTNFSNLSFKKNRDLSLTIPPTTPDQTDTLPSAFRSPMNEATFAPLESPSLQSPQPTSALVSFEPTPTSTTIVPAIPAGSSILRRRPSVLEHTISPVVLTQSPSMIEVDNFLDSLMPEKLAAPLEPAVERPLGPVPPKPIHARAPLPGRILKMWKWSGPLFYKSAENPLCRVMMHVPRNAAQGLGLKFSIIFQGLEKIEVNYMYDYSDIRSIVPAFRKPPQLALIGPEGDEDASKFRVMIHYMEKQQRVFMVPVHLDDNIIGYTVFFPYSLGLCLFGAQPPSEYSEPGTLVVAILPYALSQEQIKAVPQAPKTQLHATIQQGLRTRSIVKHPRHYRANKILGFPEALRKFLSDPSYTRTFTIWPDPDSKTSVMKDRQILETNLLLNILAGGQRTASSKSDARVAFIHISSLHQIHKFPEFAERRTKSILQFYTYGTHYDVPPDMWAVKEIYPCGGVITFTPSAMHRDPVKVRQLIIQIGRHPLWGCYILPASLGLLAQIECGTDDPLLRLERKQLMMEGILQSIEDGEVALMQAPPEKPIVSQQKDERANWASQYVNFIPPTKKQALQTGIMAFVQNPGLGRSKEVIEKVIVKDLSMMQRHPAFMTSYRRFVVINLEAEGSRCGEYYEGFEWTSASKFDFRDDFYPKQTIGMN